MRLRLGFEVNLEYKKKISGSHLLNKLNQKKIKEKVVIFFYNFFFSLKKKKK